jgi:hypothetical protein
MRSIRKVEVAEYGQKLIFSKFLAKNVGTRRCIYEAKHKKAVKV